MPHSTITLTMDAYGHVFPGQVEDPFVEHDIVARVGGTSSIQQDVRVFFARVSRYGTGVCLKPML